MTTCDGIESAGIYRFIHRSCVLVVDNTPCPRIPCAKPASPYRGLKNYRLPHKPLRLQQGAMEVKRATWAAGPSEKVDQEKSRRTAVDWNPRILTHPLPPIGSAWLPV